MQKSDVQGMMSAFATDVLAEHGSLEASLYGLGSYEPVEANLTSLPSGDVNSRIMEPLIASRHAATIYYQYLALSSAEAGHIGKLPSPDGGTFDYTQVVAVDQSAAQAYYAKLSKVLDGHAFSDITGWRQVPLQSVASPSTYEDYEAAGNKRTIAQLSKELGAAELKDFVVAVDTSAGSLLLTGATVRYGNRWWISNFPGIFGSVLGAPPAEGGFLSQ